MSDINRARLLDDLRALATIGAQPDGGVDRLAWSDADLAGRRWYGERIRQAGLGPPGAAAPNAFCHLAGGGRPCRASASPLRNGPHRRQLVGAARVRVRLRVLPA